MEHGANWEILHKWKVLRLVALEQQWPILFFSSAVNKFWSKRPHRESFSSAEGASFLGGSEGMPPPEYFEI